MTAAGLEALRAEIAELEGPARRAIAEEIKTARGFGDLKENAEYHEAKNAQARLETKILQLRQRLGDARVVEAAHGEIVGFGSTVELEDEGSGKRMTYTLVAGHEASASEGSCRPSRRWPPRSTGSSPAMSPSCRRRAASGA